MIENKEYKKEVSKLKIEKEILTKNNAKLGEIATKKCDELYNEISKGNYDIFDLEIKKTQETGKMYPSISCVLFFHPMNGNNRNTN